MLGETIHIISKYLSHEVKAASVGSKVEALEAENAKLRKKLISAMDEANTTKEKSKALADDLKTEKKLTVEKDEQLQAVNRKVKTITAKAIEAFQHTEEYNIVLFSWYYKGFKLFRQYLVKHPTSVDLGSLHLEEVDKEMEMDEASQSTTANFEGNAPENAPAGGDEAALSSIHTYIHTYIYIYIYFFFVFGCSVCFWACHSNSKTMLFAQCFLGFGF